VSGLCPFETAGVDMKQKPSFKNMPKMQAKKFARLRLERQRQRLRDWLRRLFRNGGADR